MDTNVKILVAQLPAIIENCTQRLHDDVTILLNYLLKYVKKTYASRTCMLYQLEVLESLLSKKYGGNNPKISKHIKQIRQGLDVRMKGNAGTVPSIGNKWTSHNINQILEKSASGQSGSTVPDAFWKRAKPRPGIQDSEAALATLEEGCQLISPISRSETTQLEESVRVLDTNKQHAGEEDLISETTQLEESVRILDISKQHAGEENLIYYAGSTDEVHFFEQSLILLKAMINNDTKDPVEILIPPPPKNIKEKVKTSYTYILDVARETRQLKTENQYLKMILDNLHKNVIVGQSTSQKELKPPERVMSDQTLTELTTITQNIMHRFYELETELDYIHRRISQLSAMIDGAQGSEVQISSQERTIKFTAKGRKPKSSHARATPQTARSLKLENDLELIASAWRQMQETDRLSDIFGTKLTHELPSIADLSDPYRPTKLAERYSDLYINQWSDAFSTLSKYHPEASDEKLAGFLYTILVDGYRFCERVRMRQKRNIEDIMFHPDASMEFNLGRQPDIANDELAILLSDAAKVSSTVTSVNVAKAFLENEEMKTKYGKMVVSCKTYIEECVTLCWLMQVQTPPICMDLKTAKNHLFQKDTYRHYTSKGIYIVFVVWPALFLHKGGPLLAKGVAEGNGKLHQKP